MARSKEKEKFRSLFEYYGFTKKDEKEYPVVSGILKELTPERIKQEIEKIQAVELPEELQKWVEKYEKVGDRDRFIWKWTYLALKKVTLPIVAKKHREHVLINKTLSTILNALFDDIADKKKDEELLEGAIEECVFRRLPEEDKKSHLGRKDREYLEMIKELWCYLGQALKDLPCYQQFKDIFLYDYRQFFNSALYSYLVTKNLDLINLREYRIYLSPNIQGMISGTIDLMASPTFDINEMGILREIFWNAQRMGRIGNSLSTWKREIFENDFTSEVFAYVMTKMIISRQGLLQNEKSDIERKIEDSRIENCLFEDWEKNYYEIRKKGKEIKSFDSHQMLKGLKNLLLMHLCSEGLK